VTKHWSDNNYYYSREEESIARKFSVRQVY
jgi:hypothetical protein